MSVTSVYHERLWYNHLFHDRSARANMYRPMFSKINWSRFSGVGHGTHSIHCVER